MNYVINTIRKPIIIMINKEELAIGNAVFYEVEDRLDKRKKWNEVNFIEAEDLVYLSKNNDDKYNPIELTKEVLKNNLGFEVTDMGDFWQAQNEDFVLVQIKFNFGNVQMPWIFMINSSMQGSIKFNSVHHLQNTYYDLKGKELKWKN